MQLCPGCSKPLQFKAMTSLLYGFIPSCNKNTLECVNCKKVVVKLNWFLIVMYFNFGAIFFWGTVFLGFKVKLPLALNIFNIMLGLGSYVIIAKGIALRYKYK